MTQRERRRQMLLWTIQRWMRYTGFFALMLASACTFYGTGLAAEPLVEKPLKSSPEKPKPAALQDKPKAAVQMDVKKEEKKEDKKDEKKIEKTVKGSVSFIRKNKMAVEYSKEKGEEILLKIEKDVQLKNAKDFSEIQTGDKVKVVFVETFREPKEKDGERIVLSMVVKQIELLGKAKPEGLVS